MSVKGAQVTDEAVAATMATAGLEATAMAADRRDGYLFSAYPFLHPPTREFMDSVLAIVRDNNCDDGSRLPGAEYLQSFAENTRDKDFGERLFLIAVDRTHLVSGAVVDGPRPPYHSGFSQDNLPQEILASLKANYLRNGFVVAESVRVPPDNLGLELSFMAELCNREIELLKETAGEPLQELFLEQQSFFTCVLEPFATAYATEMFRQARTDFFRGFALLLKTFIYDENRYFKNGNF
jgi:hypothetical protein